MNWCFGDIATWKDFLPYRVQSIFSINKIFATRRLCLTKEIPRFYFLPDSRRIANLGLTD